MVNIIHRVGIKAPIAQVYHALATTVGIGKWWTRETTGRSAVGETINVRFTTADGTVLGSMDMVVDELVVNQRIRWRFTTGPTEWIGTDVLFELTQADNFTIVLFSHRNWREAIEFTAHCSMKWATFMLSLKELVETGTGKPSPGDVKIDNWN